MFKKRLITLGVALFALISVVGIGFSSWYFTNEKKADVNSNVLVTHASDFGEFKNLPTDTLSLQLDQPNGTASNISVCKVSGNTATAANELTGVWEVSKDDYDKAGNLNYSIIIYIKTATLGKYVKVSSDFTSTTIANTTNHEHATDYTAYKLDLSSASKVFVDGATNSNLNKTGAYVDTTTDSSKASVTFKLDLLNDASFFEWQTGKAPATFTDYQTMVKELGCTSVTTADDVAYGTTYVTSGTDVIVEFAVSRTAA